MPLTRRQFLKSSALSIGLTTLGTTARTASAADPGASSSACTARLTVLHPAHFRILQITDLHFFSREKETWDAFNQRTVENMRTLVRLAKPGLLLVTGDVWSEDQGGMGETHMRYAIRQLEALGVPWAFTWGNHDQLPDYVIGHEAFTTARNSLYRGAASDGNYAIDIIDRRGRRLWQIVCLNTHRDGVQPEQRQWLQSLAKADPEPVPRFAFFHIPLKQYDEASKNGTTRGISGEPVCMEKEDGSTLPILKSLGVRACFCGHDHQNDYSGVVDGVELVYGRVTRAGGYAPEIFPKGGKLITVNCNHRRYNWVSLTLDGARWRPKPRTGR